MEVFEGQQGVYVRRGIIAVSILLALFLGAKVIGEVLGFRYIGSMPMTNMITVEGDGEAVAIPDTAEFTFSVVEKASTVTKAQETATTKANAAIDYLKGQGIEEKDIKTVAYTVTPQYEWQQVCSGGICPTGKSVLTGYEVRQTVSVKVRDTKKAGDLLTGVGAAGAVELSGLSFTIDDDEKIKSEARKEAIDEAKAKAEVLADELGVRLVRVISFNESPIGGIYPMYYGRDAAMGMGGAVLSEKAVNAPNVSTGENTYSSHVTITYEIR